MIKILPKLLVLFLFFSCNNSEKNQINEGTEEEKAIQILTPDFFITDLSDELHEISGLISYNDLFWGFNDSGGKNRIYGFDESGKIKKEVEIEDAKNRDWESITQDEKNIYVGDFGNNYGSRDNLCIYKIKKKDLKDEKEQKVDSKKIEFEYSNQEEFSFFGRSTPFDCEAMTEFNGSLYIFSKDWKNFTTTVYKIPTDNGEYKVHPLDSFNVDGLVTGADISPDKKKLALVGYKNFKSFMWLFSNFQDDKFFDAKSIYYQLNKLDGAQTEGICFNDNTTILISCEKSGGFKQQVFKIDLTQTDNGTP